MLRVLVGVITRLFSLIIQRSRQSGEIPDDWKKGNVTLPFKKGRKENIENYGAAEPRSLGST